MTNDDNDRFITFKTRQGIEHTVRLVDIQAVGVGGRNGTPDSYVQIFNFPHTVDYSEALRVRARWLQEG